jgi:glycosyltransferase involved in cell wall biosynthesis
MELAKERVFVRHNLVPRRLAVHATREPIVCYVGRLDEAKGIPLLMAGWERYCAMSGDPGLRLVVAGGGVLEPELRAWASGRPSVEVLGQVSGAQCSELMARSLAVIVPSLVEESFGLAAVEAMSVGVPPIAAGHGGLAEIVTPDIDGVLFQPGDPEALAAAIADVGANPARYEKYGHQAREAYEQRFSPERSLEKLLDIYRFAIANPVGARSAGRQLPRLMRWLSDRPLVQGRLKDQVICRIAEKPTRFRGHAGWKTRGSSQLLMWMAARWWALARQCGTSPRYGRTPG